MGCLQCGVISTEGVDDGWKEKKEGKWKYIMVVVLVVMRCENVSLRSERTMVSLSLIKYTSMTVPHSTH